MSRGYGLVRPKREWVPEWLWSVAASLDRRGTWLCWWLTRDRTRAEMIGSEEPLDIAVESSPSDHSTVETRG